MFVNSVSSPPSLQPQREKPLFRPEDVNNQITLFTVAVNSYFDCNCSEASVCLFGAGHHLLIYVSALHSCICG